METSDINWALLAHVPVPDNVAVGGIDVGAVVTVAVLVGDTEIGVSVSDIVLTAVAVDTVSTGRVFGNEQAEIAIKMDKRKMWDL